MSKSQAAQSDGYKWVMLLAYVLMSLGIWSCWFAQAPLKHVYWEKVFHLSDTKANLLLSLPGLVAIFVSLIKGRWIDTYGVRKMMILSGILTCIAFVPRPFMAANFTGQAILTLIGGAGVCILTATLPVMMYQWFGAEKAHTFIGIGAGSFFVGGGLGILGTAVLYGPPVTDVAAATLSATHVLTIWSVVMAAVTVFWIVMAKDKVVAGGQHLGAFGTEFKNVMGSASAWLIALYAIFIAGITVCTMGFLPGQMIVLHGLKPQLAGTVVGLYSIAMGVGMAILPSFAGAVGKKKLTVILCAITTAVWIFYMAAKSMSIPELLVFAVIFGFFFEAPWATGMALMTSLPGVTPANVGLSSGVYTMATNIGVFCLPLVLGGVMDAAGGPFKPSGNWAGMWAILIGYGIALVVMFAVKEKAAETAKVKAESA
ncbi:MAG: MFS transporter [Syntrophobacteraceae bacterium]|nr:MFS transporter [Syntrophobacteraceae bacterium]